MPERYGDQQAMNASAACFPCTPGRFSNESSLSDLHSCGKQSEHKSLKTQHSVYNEDNESATVKLNAVLDYLDIAEATV